MNKLEISVLHRMVSQKEEYFYAILLCLARRTKVGRLSSGWPKMSPKTCTFTLWSSIIQTHMLANPRELLSEFLNFQRLRVRKEKFDMQISIGLSLTKKFRAYAKQQRKLDCGALLKQLIMLPLYDLNRTLLCSWVQRFSSDYSSQKKLLIHTWTQEVIHPSLLRTFHF